MYYISLILRIIAMLCGLFLICVRLFLYEREHGKIQSKIEDIWNSLDEMYPRALARHLAFMRLLARGFTASFDKVFGPKLLSVESVVVTVCCSFSSFFVIGFIFKGIVRREWNVGFLLNALVYAGFGSVPLLLRLGFRKGVKAIRIRRDAARTWLAIILIVLCWQVLVRVVEMIYEDADVSSLLGLTYLSMLIAIGVYFLSVVIIRQTFRAIEKSESFVRPILLCLVNLTPALAVVLAGLFFWYALDQWFTEAIPNFVSPEETMSEWVSNPTFRIQFSILFPVVCLIFFELIFFLSASLFVTFAAFLIGHRLFWPAVLRLLYASKKNEIVSKGRVLIIVGAALIVIGLGEYEWLFKFFK